MKLFSKIILLIVISCFSISPVYAQQDIKEAIVKVYTVYDEHDYGEPWKMIGQQRRTGSGCIIEGKRILTNAHVVGDQTFIQVKRAGQVKKYVAEVEAVAHECDLALLKVADEAFFSGVEPLKIGSLPEVKDKVTVYGFPTGGDKLCITEGIISRVEYQQYAHSGIPLLTCQMDAAINPGSSGGPVVKNDEIVGVAFQAAEGENIGYMVPAPVIRRFLKDISDGSYEGIPALGVLWQSMENPSIRFKYNMQKEQSGVLIVRIIPDSAAAKVLKPGDILLSIEGRDIENDGTIKFRNDERIYFSYAIQSKYIGDSVRLKILRRGRVIPMRIRLTNLLTSCHLVPYMQYDTSPTYYIVGGLVFQPLTMNYLQSWPDLSYAPSNLVNYCLNGQISKERKQVIVLTKVLADEINVDYEWLEDEVISRVNGKKISTMKDLVQAVEENTGKYDVFIVEGTGRQIVLNKDGLSEANRRILERYKINSDRSEDLGDK
ncbi:MAG: trypsin-like peptidase domain-containing protein [Candidatus Omnitrophica bacterium]|nr:trypsin-like peptidase domain-containing protein [Candidatus Omnitrophota bacterium]